MTMNTGKLTRRLTAMALLIWATTTMVAAAPFRSIVGLDGIDLEATRGFVVTTDPKAPDATPTIQDVPVKRDTLNELLGFEESVRISDVWRTNVDDSDGRSFLRLVFREPQEIGTLYVSRSGLQQAWLLADGQSATASPLDASAWQPVALPPNQDSGCVTLPPGTRTKAILVEMLGGYRGGLRRLIPVAERFADLRNAATPQARVDDNGDDPANLLSHVEWTNTQLGRADDRLTRPPITDVHPAWIIMSWPSEQTISQLVLASNMKAMEIWALRPQVKGNPAVAPPDGWRRIRFNRTGDSFAFDAVETRAVKLVITDTSNDGVRSEQGQILVVRDLRVLSPIGDGPLPDLVVETEESPFQIPYSVDRDGELALVVNDQDGRRVANLVAQVGRQPGDHTQAWNLRRVDGSYVEPGTYQLSGIIGPRLQVNYVTSVYPNVPVNSPQNSAWLTGHSGTGGWLADHSGNSAVAAGEGSVWLAASTAESGVSTIEVDFDGNKRWGRHNLAPWRGPRHMAAYGDGVFATVDFEQSDKIWYIDAERETQDYLTLASTQTRHHGIRGLAIHGDRMYIPIISRSAAWLSNAFAAKDVNTDKVQPAMPREARGGKPEDHPDIHQEFRRLLRLTSTPGGHPHADGLVYISSGKSKESRQHIRIPFNRAVPIGTLVYQAEKQTDYTIRFSVAKPDAPFPPDVNDESHWTVIQKESPTGWVALAAPENTETRALRITFMRGGEDDLAGLLEGTAGGDPLTGAIDTGMMGGADPWEGRLEGLRFLRRRFRDVSDGSTIRVNSGTVNANGVWDAERQEPLSEANPGIYVMQWDAPQPVRGLAIQEIDGRLTEIDVYTGPAGQIDIAGDEHWQHVGSYTQEQREFYQPSSTRNPLARYLDGTVDFGETYETRAVRLRVVAQWTEREHRAEGVREDRGGTDLVPNRCHVYGVLPLAYIGGEPPVDPLLTTRLEVRDIKTKDVVREYPIRAEGPIDIGDDGTVYLRQQNHIARFDEASGDMTPVVTDLAAPTEFAVDTNGDLLVWDSETKSIYRYSPDGKRLGTIGEPGGWQAGPWVPERMEHIVDMDVDKDGQLWVVEKAKDPKRVLLYNPDGSLKRQFLGNTAYGGGGYLDRYDRSIVRYHRMQFKVDWETGLSELSHMPFLQPLERGNNFDSPELIPFMHDGRKYLISGADHPRIGWPVVFVFLDEGDHARLVAAMGMGRYFQPLEQPEFRDILAGKVPQDYAFIFVDRNGDGQVQPEEVDLTDAGAEDNPARGKLFGPDRDMGICASGGRRFEVKEFLPNGAPVYHVVQMTTLLEGARKAGIPDITYARKLEDGDYFVKASGRQARFSAEGELLWSYPYDHEGVTSLWIAPWKPGWVTHQFVMIGEEKLPGTPMEEVIVMNSNAGQWSVWTHDGLLAAQIFLHKRHPEARTLSFPEHERGMLWENLTMGQEHFSGSFVKTEEDGKTYVVAGHNHISIAEISGWDRFKRLSGTVEVTAQDIQRQMAWEAANAARDVYVRAPTIVAKPGDAEAARGGVAATIPGGDAGAHRTISFNLTYDEKNLYLYWEVPHNGMLNNSGPDPKMLFKSGAAVDFHIAADPQADPERRGPVAGDQRLLITRVKGKPVAVLYVPSDAKASDDDAWEVFTPAGGRVKFDRVQLVPEVDVFYITDSTDQRSDHNRYKITATVPLKLLGMKPKSGETYRIDWGVLTSDTGNETKQRLYWANQLNTGTADAAMEARLHPGLWGYLRFPTENKEANRAEDLLNEGGKATDMLDDLLEEL